MTHAYFCEAKGVSNLKTHVSFILIPESLKLLHISRTLVLFFLPCRSGSVSNKDVNSKTWNQSTGVAYVDLFSILGGWSISDFLCLDVLVPDSTQDDYLAMSAVGPKYSRDSAFL